MTECNNIIPKGMTSSEGYNYSEAKKIANQCRAVKDIEITYGTKTEKFHFINKQDRDFKIFSIDLGKFPRSNLKLAKDMIMRPYFIKEPYGLPFELTEKDKFRRE